MTSPKAIIYKIFQKSIQPIAERLGYVVKSKTELGQEKNLLIGIAFKNLKSRGLKPSHILDIGANHGTWTREVLEVFPNAEYSLIEPQYWLEKSSIDLQKKHNVKFYPIGMGDRNETLTFTIHERDDSSSFRFEKEEISLIGYRTIVTKMQTIDSFLEENSLPIPEIIKIDAEGLDIEVLQGASSTFGVTEVFLVEASVNQKEFSNTILKVTEFMDQKGYEIFDFTDLNRPFKNQILWLVEILFIKKNSAFGS
jgi:FkbM family methyltransferase